MVDQAVTDSRPDGTPEDTSADTQMFRAFVERAPEAERPKPVAPPFRILTLLGGLVVFALLVYLLFQL